VEKCYKVSRAFLKFLAAQEGMGLKRDYSLTWRGFHSLGSQERVRFCRPEGEWTSNWATPQECCTISAGS